MSDETQTTNTTPAPVDEQAALEAELAQLEEARAQRAKPTLDDLRRKVANEKAIAAAEREHGAVGKEIAVVDTDEGVVIVKRSNPVLFRRFQDAGKFTTEAVGAFVRPCIVHPPLDVYDALVERFPAVPARAANAVAKLAGSRAEDISGK